MQGKQNERQAILDANLVKVLDSTEWRYAQKANQDAEVLATANEYCRTKARESLAKASYMEIRISLGHGKGSH